MSEMRRVRVDGKKGGRRKAKAPGAPRTVAPTREDAAAQAEAAAPTPEATTPDAVEDVEECVCPRLDAEDWHEAESDWGDIAFLRGSTTAVLGVPVGYQAMARELTQKAKESGYIVPEDPMVLLGQGKFRRPVMVEVEPGEAAPARDLIRPGGVAFTRLLPAPYGKLGKVVDETANLAREKYGRKPDDTWVWYLTCRHCSGPRDFETLIVAHYREA
jgi:hypothetical protein